jgi:hypothetical protein
MDGAAKGVADIEQPSDSGAFLVIRLGVLDGDKGVQNIGNVIPPERMSALGCCLGVVNEQPDIAVGSVKGLENVHDIIPFSLSTAT